MFNINTFNAHKQGIREAMEANLIWDKHHGTMSHNSSRDYNYMSIEVKFDDEPAHVAEKMQMVVDIIKDGTKVELEEVTEQPLCHRYMTGIRYNYKKYHIRDEITDRQVSRAMKKLMIKKIRNETGRKYVDMDCKVMDLFKDGLIDWNTVLQSHGKDCSL